MKVFVFTAFICISVLTYGQENLRWNESQQLKWEDFSGKVNDTSRFDAECFAEVRYQYKFYSPADFEFEVFAHFDKNSSWTRKEKQSEALLKHEQMHFNIAELYAEKLKHEFENFNYTANFQEQILQLFNQKKAEYQAMQHQYDEETNHSLNKEKQREWEEFISTELRNTRLWLQLAKTIKKDIRQGT